MAHEEDTFLQVTIEVGPERRVVSLRDLTNVQHPIDLERHEMRLVETPGEESVLTPGWTDDALERTGQLRRGETNEANITALAELLQQAAFAGRVGDLIDERRRSNPSASSLTIGVHVRGPGSERLWGLPWELLTLRSRASQPGVPLRVVRVVDPWKAPDRTVHDGTLRTIVCTGPRLTEDGTYAAETGARETVAAAFGHMSGATPVDLPRGTLEDLRDAIHAGANASAPIDLLILDCHGTTGGITLHVPGSELPATVSAAQLAHVLTDGDDYTEGAPLVRVVVLAACWGGASSPPTGDAKVHLCESTAQVLAKAGIATVAFPTKVMVSTAAAWLQNFAEGIRGGQSVSDASTYSLKNMDHRPPPASEPGVWQPGPWSTVLRDPRRHRSVERKLKGGSKGRAPVIQRTSLRAKINELVNSDHPPRVIQIIGPEHSGKSTFALELEQDLDATLCAMVRHPGMEQDELVGEDFVFMLGSAIAGCTGGRQEWVRWHDEIKSATRRWRSVRDQADNYDPGHPMFVVIDGLTPADKEFEAFLTERLSYLPKWFVFVITSRTSLPNFDFGDDEIALVPLSDRIDGPEIERYVRLLAADRVAAGDVAQAVIDTLASELAAPGTSTFAGVAAELERRLGDAEVDTSQVNVASPTALAATIDSRSGVTVEGAWTALARGPDAFVLAVTDRFTVRRAGTDQAVDLLLPFDAPVTSLVATSGGEAVVIDCGSELAIASLRDTYAPRLWDGRWSTYGGRVVAAFASARTVFILLDVEGQLAKLRVSAGGVDSVFNPMGVDAGSDVTFAYQRATSVPSSAPSEAPPLDWFSVDAAATDRAGLVAGLGVQESHVLLHAEQWRTDGRREIVDLPLGLKASRVVVARSTHRQVPRWIAVQEGQMIRMFAWDDLRHHARVIEP